MPNPSTNFGGICKIWKGVITPFKKALLRLSTRHYDAFLKGIITPFQKALLRLFKRRYYAFLKGVITPFCA